METKLLHEIVVSMHRDVSIIAADIAGIKADVKEHIRRTAIAETQIERLQKGMYQAQGAIALITLAGVIFGILKFFVK